MKKVFAVLIFAAIFALSLCSCGIQYRETDFGDEEAVIVVETCRGPDFDFEDGPEPETKFWAIASGGRTKKCDPVTFAETGVFEVPFDCLQIPESNGSGYGTHFLRIALTGKDGRNIEPDGTLLEILGEVDKIEHAFLAVKIFRCGEDHFVFVELNVNMWDPCEVYYYRADTKTLYDLYVFDGEQVKNVAVVSPERLHRIGSD
ncbi:MAG: hypothetical protein J5793_02830 [Clostridia bacterium]|nr:hypothetical protein [Clostridia bacterium]